MGNKCKDKKGSSADSQYLSSNTLLKSQNTYMKGSKVLLGMFYEGLESDCSTPPSQRPNIPLEDFLAYGKVRLPKSG